jgi:hypothetical protein
MKRIDLAGKIYKGYLLGVVNWNMQMGRIFPKKACLGGTGHPTRRGGNMPPWIVHLTIFKKGIFPKP